MSVPERMDWTQDGAFVDAEGNAVGAYDDVLLMGSVPVTASGNVSAAQVPAGSRATVLFFTEKQPQIVQLECHIGERGFIFALADATELRLEQRADAKLAPNA